MTSWPGWYHLVSRSHLPSLRQWPSQHLSTQPCAEWSIRVLRSETLPWFSWPVGQTTQKRGQPTLSGTRSPWSAAGKPQSEARPARQFFLWQENVDLTASRWLRPLALRDNLPWTDVLCIPVLCHPTACTRMHHVLLLVTCPWSSSYWYTTPWIFGTLHCPHCLQKTSWWIQSHQGYWPPWHLRFWSPPRGRPELGSSATNLVARPPPGGNARALFLRTLDTKVPCGTCGCKTWKHMYIYTLDIDIYIDILIHIYAYRILSTYGVLASDATYTGIFNQTMFYWHRSRGFQQQNRPVP